MTMGLCYGIIPRKIYLPVQICFVFPAKFTYLSRISGVAPTPNARLKIEKDPVRPSVRP